MESISEPGGDRGVHGIAGGGSLDSKGAKAQHKPANLVAPDSEEAKTLFFSSLPMDVQEREIHTLLRFFPGYEGCTIARPPGKHPIAFACFTTHSQAVYTREALMGLKFEPNATYPLRVEFAHANSKVRRLPREFIEGEFQRRLSVSITDYGLMPHRSEYTEQYAPPAEPQTALLPKLDAFAFSPFLNNTNSFYSPQPPKPQSLSPSNTDKFKSAQNVFPSSESLYHVSRVNNPMSVEVNHGGNADHSGNGQSQSTTLFVGNLSKEVQRADLMRLFSWSQE